MIPPPTFFFDYDLAEVETKKDLVRDIIPQISREKRLFRKDDAAIVRFMVSREDGVIYSVSGLF